MATGTGCPGRLTRYTLCLENGLGDERNRPAFVLRMTFCIQLQLLARVFEGECPVFHRVRPAAHGHSTRRGEALRRRASGRAALCHAKYWERILAWPPYLGHGYHGRVNYRGHDNLTDRPSQ